MTLLAGSLLALRTAIGGSLGARGSGTRWLGPPLRSGAGTIIFSQRTRFPASAAGWSRRPSAAGATSELGTLARATPPLWPFAPPVTVATSRAHRARVWASQGQWQRNGTSSSTPVSILDASLSCTDTPTSLATSFVSPSPGPLHSRPRSSGRPDGGVESEFFAGLSFDKEDVSLRQGTVVLDNEITAADLEVGGLARSLADRVFSCVTWPAGLAQGAAGHSLRAANYSATAVTRRASCQGMKRGLTTARPVSCTCFPTCSSLEAIRGSGSRG